MSRLVSWIRLVLLVFVSAFPGLAGAEFEFGFARRDATPRQPLRLSGYGNRAVPSEGVDIPLFVRAMALLHEGGPVHALISVDSIGFPASFVQEVLTEAERQHGISRSRLAVCATHSHTSPHLMRGLDNLFSTPLTEQERTNATDYTDQLRDACVAAVGDAIADLKPGRMELLQGTATFARNRRVLKEGVWSGFGENPEGPVDHRLPIVAITSEAGQIRGVLFNYACHCTTFGGDYNRVNGDWAGYAAEYIEAAHPGSVALCTIGCGADQNPERDSRRALEIAQMQGRQIADETERLLATALRVDVRAAPIASFGYTGLPIDRPSIEDLKKALEDKRPQVRRHAEVMLDTQARMGRLPESYPMPIQVWRFGDEFAMVFLGGEVCVEYEHRIRRELEPMLMHSVPDAAALSSRVFVTAYANDVFGYVAPERMRAEGGYEVDYSMIYYLQPGRWSTGTEDVILRRVHELFEQKGGSEPLSVNDALKTFSLPEGFVIEVVAAEPLVRDPINMAVDERGRLWVVEMGDYPRGVPDANGWSPPRNDEGQPWDGPAGGRIRVLTDSDGDGRYDRGVTFLDGLSFPTGVYPWRGGVLVSCAPDIFYARDDNGDGQCDRREVLYTGFAEDNPQHRVNGFEYGLDGWLYLAGGSHNDEITCVKTGEKVNISGRDLRIHPDTNRLEPVSGHSQYGRCRDNFGNWYGNTNSEPLFQFVIEDRQLRRNPYVATPSPRAFLSDPPRASPVYPTSRTVDRFNDLYAADRFTSACSPFVFRDNSLGEEVAESVFICEPVHNLVSRLHVRRVGPQFSAERWPQEQESEFLSSTDPWFRPVRMMTGPDGAMWVCDMYRQVIEHPQWIPEAWQSRLNLSAGADRGRIYRIRNRNLKSDRLDRFDQWLSVANLSSTSVEDLLGLVGLGGASAELAQRLLQSERESGASVYDDPAALLEEYSPSPIGRIRLLWTLVNQKPELRADARLREMFLLHDDPEQVIHGLRVLGVSTAVENEFPTAALVSHPDARVRFELALAAGDCTDDRLRLEILRELAVRDMSDGWIRTAVLSSCIGIAPELLRGVLSETPPTDDRERLVDGLISTALGDDPQSGVPRVLSVIAPRKGQSVRDWQLSALGICLDGLDRRKQDMKALSGNGTAEQEDVRLGITAIFAAARERVTDASAPATTRSAAVRLLGRQEDHQQGDRQLLAALLNPQQSPEVQTAAIERLAALGETLPLLESLFRLGPSQQSVVESTLLQRTKSTLALLDAMQAGMVEAQRLTAATRTALTSHREVTIRESSEELIGKERSAIAGIVSERTAAVGPLTGDSAHGRVVFEKKCATCHRHNDLGNDVGPKLSALQNKSTEYLLTAILDANRSVEPKYRSCSILLVDGRQQTGLIAEETATSVTLVTADGRQQSVLRRDIEVLTLTGLSFMPEGIGRDLTDQDLADVVRFLQETE